MKEEIAQIQSDALAAIGAASGEQELDEARIAFLGKKGRLTATSAGMKNLSKEEKPVVGQLLNATRGAITEALEGKRNALQDEADRAALEGLDPQEVVDRARNRHENRRVGPPAPLDPDPGQRNRDEDELRCKNERSSRHPGPP